MTSADPLDFILWIWESPSWRVLACYPTRRDALGAAHHMADPPDTWVVAERGDPVDEYLRSHCTERDAPHQARKVRAAR